MGAVRRAFAVIMVSAVAAGAAGPDAPVARAQQPGITECGDIDRGVGIKNLTTRRVSCRRARRIARAHPRDATPYGFRCREREIAQYQYDIRCARGARVVRWQYVSD
jgi:hypothetical protein